MSKVVVVLTLLISGLLLAGAPADAAGGCQRTLASYPTLERGDHGRAVRTLQCALNDLGLGPVTVDGDYGAQTQAAVTTIERGFEGSRDEPGLVDAGFWVLLYGRQLPEPLPAYGDRGHDVRTLQRALRAAGYRVVVDGQYGAQTRTTLKRYTKACRADTGFALAGGCAPR